MRKNLIDELTASRLLSALRKTAGVLVDCEKHPLHSDLDGLVENYGLACQAHGPSDGCDGSDEGLE